jgi:hypothetical protein
VAVKGTVTMKTIGEVADRFGEVFGWLSRRGVEPVAAPFLKYDLIAMENEVDVEACVREEADLEKWETVLGCRLADG